MNVYHIHGSRRYAVVFAETPEDAVAQAIEQGMVNDWEKPYAIEVPLPKGYRLAYDPLVGSMEQPGLPLRVPPRCTHLLTWQELLARIQATMDPAMRPLLAHASRLSYLQPLTQISGETRPSAL